MKPVRLTLRVLTELQQGPMASGEIAAVLGLTQQQVSAVLCNLREQQCVRPIGARKMARRGKAQYIYKFVKMPRPNHRPYV